MAYPSLGGVDPRDLDRLWLPRKAASAPSILGRFDQTYAAAPSALEAAPPVQQPAAAPSTPAPGYGIGYTAPPQQAGTPVLAPQPGGYGSGGTTFTAPSGIVYNYSNGNWTPDRASLDAFMQRGIESAGGDPAKLQAFLRGVGAAEANDRMWLERAREDWQAQQLQGVRASPETQARAGQLQEQGRRELYGRAFGEAGKYGEAMSARGLGESATAGMVQGDIMQNAAEAKADADLAALNMAIAEGQNLIFGGEALRKPTTAALLQDALDARAFERRAALQRELAPDEWMQLLGSVAGTVVGGPLGALGGYLGGRAASAFRGGGGGGDYDREWDPNRVPVEW